MQDESLHIITLAAVKRKYPQLEPWSLGDDFIACRMDGKLVSANSFVLGAIRNPVRFDAFVCLYCAEGEFQMEVNMKRFWIRKDSIFFCFPGSILRIVDVDIDNIADIRFVLVLTSKELMRNVRFEYNNSFKDSYRLLEHPTITLNPTQRIIARDYLRLIQKIMQSSITDKFNVISLLLGSIVYSAADLWSKQLAAEDATEKDTDKRMNLLFTRFIELVSKHCAEHRYVAFYADRLDLTPKYLSKLIKQASGMTAPEWIDRYIILEIMNRLKYTDCSVSDLIEQFHFSSPATFYKFFRAQTGTTPTEFRKGNNSK